jgi:hypothetical protein
MDAQSGMMAKPMTTSQSTKGKNADQLTTRSLGLLPGQKATILLLKNQPGQDIAAEGLAPPKWTALL